MKNRFTFSILSVLAILSLFFSSSVFAVDNVATTPAQPLKQEAAPIANVNIQNTKIISQKDNVFNISFELSNGKMLQTGVKYGVKLVSKIKDNQILADEKVYDESLTLQENSKTSKIITYTAPSTLSGTYSLVLFSSNSSGFPFAISLVKEVILSASVKGFEIVTDSCYLKVEGDKNNVHYTLTQGVDIASTESLRLTCNTINHTSNALSLTPSYETRYHSSYGDIAPVTGGDISAIPFAGAKSESLSLVLPKGITSQVYNVNISLKDGSNTSSNIVNAKYIIRGVNATIENLSLDKDYYKVADKALLSIVWSSSSALDHLVRGVADSITPKLSLTATITNNLGSKCGEIIDHNLVRDPKSPQTQIPVTILSSCFSPRIAVSIKDDAGNVLDQKNFNVQTMTVSPQSVKPSSHTMLGIILLLIAIALIGVLIKRRKHSPMPPTSGLNIN